jgi:acyl-CoA synthetase
VIVLGGVNQVISAVSADGAILWQHHTSAPVFSSPALVHGHDQASDAVVCGTHDGHVCCLELDGTLKWQVRIGDKAIFSSPFVGTCWLTGEGGIDSAGHLNNAPLIATCDTTGAVHLLNGEGVTLTRVTCLGEVFSSPVLVDESLFVGCRDDHLYCFQLA